MKLEKRQWCECKGNECDGNFPVNGCRLHSKYAVWKSNLTEFGYYKYGDLVAAEKDDLDSFFKSAIQELSTLEKEIFLLKRKLKRSTSHS